jgi:hypothetical protein
VKTWIVTFGSAHTHPLTGEPLGDAYVRVPADTSERARRLMTISVFGLRWSHLYEYANLEDVPDGTGVDPSCYAGVRMYRLREVEWIPPSAVAEMLARANADHTSPTGKIAPSRWIVDVVQPAEIAHQRAVRLIAGLPAEPARCSDCDAPAVVAHQPGWSLSDGRALPGAAEGQPGPKCRRHAGPDRDTIGRPSTGDGSQ